MQENSPVGEPQEDEAAQGPPLDCNIDTNDTQRLPVGPPAEPLPDSWPTETCGSLCLLFEAATCG